MESLGLETVFASRTLVPTSQLITPLEDYPKRVFRSVKPEFGLDFNFLSFDNPVALTS